MLHCVYNQLHCVFWSISKNKYDQLKMSFGVNRTQQCAELLGFQRLRKMCAKNYTGLGILKIYILLKSIYVKFCQIYNDLEILPKSWRALQDSWRALQNLGEPSNLRALVSMSKVWVLGRKNVSKTDGTRLM